MASQNFDSSTLIRCLSVIVLSCLSLLASANVLTERSTSPPFVGLKKNIPIGTVDGVDLTINIALPEKPAITPSPVMVMIHGGGFIKGDKSKFSKTLTRLADKGIVAASLMYRFAPEHKFPAQVEDVKAAIRFLKAHAEEYNLDPDRIVVNGSSAGGYLAIMLGVTGNNDEFSKNDLYTEQNSKVHAVIAGSTAPVDFSLPQYRSFKIIQRLIPAKDLNNDAFLLRVSPTYYLDKNDPRFFLYHGDADKIAPVKMMQDFTRLLDTLGHSYTYIEVEGGGHSLSKTQPQKAKEVRDASIYFFKKETTKASK